MRQALESSASKASEIWIGGRCGFPREKRGYEIRPILARIAIQNPRVIPTQAAPPWVCTFLQSAGSQESLQTHAILLLQQWLPQVADFPDTRRNIPHRKIFDPDPTSPKLAPGH